MQRPAVERVIVRHVEGKREEKKDRGDQRGRITGEKDREKSSSYKEDKAAGGDLMASSLARGSVILVIMQTGVNMPPLQH